MRLMKILKELIFVSTILTVLSPSLAFSLGPYTGVVLDSLTDKPVEGASVLFYWTKSIPQIMHSRSETIAARLIYTDHQGRYKIPSVSANFGLMGSLESTNVIIYQPGYKVYIISIRHNNPYYDPSKDPPFKDKGNNVELERIPPGFNHTKHVELIDRALWGIDYYPGLYDRPQNELPWEKMLEAKLKEGFEKQEFLSRVEWEERRSREESNRVWEEMR